MTVEAPTTTQMSSIPTDQDVPQPQGTHEEILAAIREEAGIADISPAPSKTPDQSGTPHGKWDAPVRPSEELEDIRSKVDALPPPNLEQINDLGLNEFRGADIVYSSFDISQGKPTLHENIFRYVHNIRPEWQLTSELSAKIKLRSIARIRNYLRPSGTPGKPNKPVVHEPVNFGGIVANVEDAMKQMQRAFGEELLDEDTHTELLAKILSGMSDGDKKYLLRSTGRQREGVKQGTPKSDPKFSFVVHYIIRGHRTGQVEIDSMLDELSTIKSDRDRFDWSHLVSKYNNHHPDSTISVEDFV